MQTPNHDKGDRPAIRLTTRSGFLVSALGCGVLLGLLNSLSNLFGSPYSPASLAPGVGVFALEVLAAVLGTPGAWAATAFIAGTFAHRLWAGPVGGVAALLVADVTYYLSDSINGYAALSWDEVLFWAALAVPTGLVMGQLGVLASQPFWWSILPGLAGPAALVVLARPSGSDHIQPWPMQATLVAAGLLLTFAITRWLWQMRRTRPIPTTGR